MFHVSERHARGAARAGAASSALSKTIAAAVDVDARARAAEVAGAYLSNLMQAGQLAAAKGAC